MVISIDGKRVISDIEAGTDQPPAGAIRLDGLTVPAFANAHSHAFHRVLRGRAQLGSGDFWTWRRIMYAAAATLDPDSYKSLATAVFAEMAMAGFGAVGEFHYVHHDPDGQPYSDPNAMGEALVAAAGDAGVRLTLLDTLYLHGGLGDGPDAGVLAPDTVQQRFSDGTAEAWAERAEDLHSRFDGPMVRAGAAIHSVRAVDPASAAVAAHWCEQHEAPLHIHASEQPAENAQCLAHYGRTPIGLLDEHGILGPRTTLIHATHVTDDDIERLARTGTCVCFCPTTERDLADGIGPGTAMREAGIELCLGSDSHAVIDPFEEARGFEYDERLRSLKRGNTPVDTLWAMAGANGHRSLGWPEGGVVRVGHPADLVSVSLDSVRTAGWSLDALSETVLYAATAADVTDVIVAGKHIVRDGRHSSVDVGALLHDSITSCLSPASH